MRDIVLADTVFMAFTTRAFATGIPTVLAGTPVVSAYEDAGLTQITAGITLGVDHDAVVGLNMLTIVATGANGFEADKDYNLVITTGTVGGVSVVGEVVGQFSIQRAPVNWANVTDPTTAVDLSATDIQLCDTVTTLTGHTVQTGDNFTRLGAPAGASVSVDIADVPTVAEFNARTLIAASYFDPAADAVANVTLVATTTTNTDMRGTDSALLAASAPTNFGDLAITVTTGLVSVGTNNDKTGYSISGTITTLDGLNNFAPATDVVASVTLVATTTTNTDMRGTDSAALASVVTEARLSELDEATAGKMANQVDIIQVDTTTDIPALIAALNDISVADILTTQMIEAFAADGVAPTLAQALFMIQQILGDFGIAGTTLTVRKIDGVTTAATFTLDDDTNPTDLTRAT